MTTIWAPHLRGTDRRARRAAFRYPERRTGFDRRSPGGVIASYRDHPGILAAVLTAVVILNLMDLLLTLRALERGATEANPIMSALFELDNTLAGSFKMLVAVGVVLVIWRMRRYRRILQVSLLALVGFSTLIVYQLVAAGA